MKAIKKWVVAHKESGLKLGLLLILALAAWSNPLNRVPEVCKMPLEFSGTNQHLVFADVAHLDNLTQKTVMAWVDPDTFGENSLGAIISKLNVTALGGFSMQLANDGSNGTNTFFAYEGSSGAISRWRAPNGSILTGGGLYHIAYSMDKGSISNDPVLYVDGVPVAVTEITAPSGSFGSDAGEELWIGDTRFDNRAFDGPVSDLRIYNRILTPAEIASIYAARGADGPGDAVFWCPGLGAEGVSAPDTALGSTNYVYDQIKGIAGTPSGSPILRADRYLSYP
jgi:hypothetical protein